MIDYKVILGDCHHPFANFDILREAKGKVDFYRRKKKKVLVIQMGDITDQKAWSRYSKDVDDLNPTDEWERTVEDMNAMAKMFPKMTVILGNHDVRIIKKCIEAGIPDQLIPKLEDIFDYGGWDWHLGHRPLIVDGVMYVHGDEFAGNAIAKAKRAGMSVVQGHDHQMYLEYLRCVDNTTFGMGVGCTMATNTQADAYAIKNPMGIDAGYAEIIKGIPHLIPFF